MTEIDQLIPAIEHCRKIPKGEFCNTFFVWRRNDQKKWVPGIRRLMPTRAVIVAAPTVQEIFDAIPWQVSQFCMVDGCTPSLVKPDAEHGYSCSHTVLNSDEFDSPLFKGRNIADGMLRVWLWLRDRGMLDPVWIAEHYEH